MASLIKTRPELEIFHSGAWHDITSTEDVYTRDPLAITRGLPDQSGVVPPSTLSATIENRDGQYSARLPTSPLYGLIGRNTPVRLSVLALNDEFGRTVANSWGSVDGSGEAWQNGWIGGAPGDFDVAAGVGTHLVDGASEARVSWLPSTSFLDVETAVTVSGMPANVTGGSLEPANLLLRMQSINLYYMCRVVITTAEAVQLQIYHEDSGLATLIASTTVAGLTHTGAAMRVRAQVEGKLIRMKAWLLADGEPFDWQLTTIDDRIMVAGGVGIRSGVAGGNSNVPVTFAYDDFDVRLPRFHGEIESWPIRWNVKGSDVWAPITANGIMRRLNAPGVKKRTLSALALAAVTLGPFAFWACEDGKDATQGANGVPGGPPLVSDSSGPLWGEDDGPPGVASVLTIGPNDHLRATVVCPSTTSWTVAFWLRSQAEDPLTSPPLANLVPLRWYTPGSAVHEWRISAFKSSVSASMSLFARTSTGAATSLNPGHVVDLMDGEWHYIAVRATQNGGNIDTEITVDQATASESIAGTLEEITEFVLGQEVEGDLSSSPEGNVLFIQYAGITACSSSAVEDLYDAGLGYPGETAGARLSRLSERFGTPMEVLGDNDLTAPMGPQLVKSELDLYRDAAAADGGILFEQRGAFGLAYLPLRELYNQAPRATVNYAAGDELAADLAPVENTQHVANDVTVKRHGGGSARVEQTTGPLNVQEPWEDAQGVGRIPSDPTLVLFEDGQCIDVASWLKHLGTWDEYRYPLVAFDLSAMTNAGKLALRHAVASLNIGDRLAIDDAPTTWLTFDQIEALVQGVAREVIASHHWTLAFNTTPALPYEVFNVSAGSGSRSRIPPGRGMSTVNEAVDTTETSIDVISTTVRWIDSAGFASHFPFDVMIGGELMTVTAISGTTLTQTFTVTRSVNGVVKTHPSGTEIALFRSPVLAL